MSDLLEIPNSSSSSLRSNFQDSHRFSEYDYLIKLVIIGDSGVGKSSMLLQFADHCFTPSFISTIGVDFKIQTLNIGNKVAKIQIWDTAGQERFRTITSSYYRGSHGVMVVYDVNNRDTFDNVMTWIGEIQKYANPDAHLILVGNKTDLTLREVTTQEGQDLAQHLGMAFIETSAKTNSHIDAAFRRIAELHLDRIQSSQIQATHTVSPNSTTGVSISSRPLGKKSCC